jgi:transposase
MPVRTISLDVHSDWSQLVAADANGVVFLETQVETRPEPLRRLIGGIPGPKRVLFEEGPLSALIHDALDGIVQEIVSCDSTRNALIARAEDSNDARDARRLITLDRAGAVHPVYVPHEPYRTLRSLLSHDRELTKAINGVKNRIKAIFRRQGICTRGVGIFKPNGRRSAGDLLANAALRWQAESLYDQLELLTRQRQRAHRLSARQARGLSVVKRLQSTPGVGPITARTLVAWIVTPERFKSRNALAAYAGLGIGQGFTNWQPVGRARASKRGQRAVKRVVFLAANAAIKGSNALARRYRARLAAGWPHRKAIRDVARKILFISQSLWISGKEYQDDQVSVPDTPGQAP